MAKKHNKRFDEENVLNDILTYNSDSDIKKKKKAINKYLPNDIKVIAKNESQKKLINSIRNNEITICAGPPGMGKTFVSVAFALNLLKKENNRFKNVFLIKSVTTLKGEEMGFLKGDVNEKIEPVMWSFKLNMEKIMDSTTIDKLISEEIIRPLPLGYIRGVSLDDCIIIADEMQNVNLDNSKTLMTRIGRNTKIIMLGDINQIDIKNKKESSLKDLLLMFNNTEGIGVIDMSNEDTENIRNPIIKIIEKRYDDFLNKK